MDWNPLQGMAPRRLLTTTMTQQWRIASPLRVWAGSEPTGTLCCGKTDCTSALPPPSWLTVASVPLSRYLSTQRRSLESAMLWLVLISCTTTTRTSFVTSSSSDSSHSLQGMSFTLLTPTLFASFTPSELELDNNIQHKQQIFTGNP